MSESSEQQGSLPFPFAQDKTRDALFVEVGRHKYHQLLEELTSCAAELEYATYKLSGRGPISNPDPSYS